jgi:hypothetical protein
MTTTLTGGQSATVGMDAFASIAITVASKATLSFSSAADNLRSDISITQAQSKTYGPFGVPGTMTITCVDGSMTYQVHGNIGGLAYDGDSTAIGTTGQDSEVWAVSEVSEYVTRTTTGTAFTGACEFAGYICTVADGNITIYDNTSAAGTVIVPTTALTVGAFPIFGAGTNGKMALTTGCHVVLSGAATVNVLVQ